MLFPIHGGWDAPSIFALWLAARCAPMHVPVTKDVRMDRHGGLWMAGMQPRVVDKFFVRPAAALAWRWKVAALENFLLHTWNLERVEGDGRLLHGSRRLQHAVLVSSGASEHACLAGAQRVCVNMYDPASKLH